MADDEARRAEILGRIIEEDEERNDDDEDKTLTQAKLRHYKYSLEECWACKYVNDKVIENDFRVRKLWQLYTDNKCRVPNPQIAIQMHEYYNRWLRDVFDNFEWTPDCILEHITLHSMYPTDELVEQFASLKAVRMKLADNLFNLDDEGALVSNHNNIKTWLMVCREIRSVLEIKPKIPNYIGYSKPLNF